MSQRIIERTGRPPATEDEALDIVLAVIDETSDAAALLKKWRQYLTPNGGIWLLTAKRGQPGYVDQRELIAAGQQAEVVDNKVCSVSPTMSAMRFVIRKKDRGAWGGLFGNMTIQLMVCEGQWPIPYSLAGGGPFAQCRADRHEFRTLLK